MKKKEPGPYKKFNDPMNNTIINIIQKHPEFWNESKIEFNQLYNNDIEISKLLNKIENNIDLSFGKDIITNIKKEKISIKKIDNVVKILYKIRYKFMTLHPKLFSEYFVYCSYHKINIPKEDYIQILKINDLKTLMKFLNTNNLF